MLDNATAFCKATILDNVPGLHLNSQPPPVECEGCVPLKGTPNHPVWMLVRGAGPFPP
jgi:hypothetical protein